MFDGVTSTGTTTGPLTDTDYFDDSVAGGGLSFGYDFSYHFGVPVRIEGEYIHIVRVDADTRPIFSDASPPAGGIANNASIRTLMMNTYYDWDLDTWYTPYVGFGIGYGRNHSGANLLDFGTGIRDEVDTETHNIAWSLMAGMQFDMSDNWFADLGYRYIDSGEIDTWPFTVSGVALHADDVARHDVMIGFGYRF